MGKTFKKEELAGAVAVYPGCSPFHIDTRKKAADLLQLLERCDDIRTIKGKRTLSEATDALGLAAGRVKKAYAGLHGDGAVVTFALHKDWETGKAVEEYEVDMETGEAVPVRRGRGRPKGQKNREGHKAGHPKGVPNPGSGRRSETAHLHSGILKPFSMGIPEISYTRAKELKASGFDLERRFEMLVDEWWNAMNGGVFGGK